MSERITYKLLSLTLGVDGVEGGHFVVISIAADLPVPDSSNAFRHFLTPSQPQYLHNLISVQPCHNTRSSSTVTTAAAAEDSDSGVESTIRNHTVIMHVVR